MAAWVLLAGAMVACGPAVVLPEDTEPQTTGASSSTGRPDADATTASPPISTTSGAGTTTPPAPVATSAATTIDVDSTSSGTGSSTDSGSSTGDSACPASEGFDAYIWLNNGNQPQGPASFVCTIVGLAELNVNSELELDCGGVTQTLAIWTPAVPAFPPSGQVLLETLYTADVPSTRSVIKLTDADGQLLIASAQTSVFPGEGVVPDDFFEPLAVSRLEETCVGEPPDGGFIKCDPPLGHSPLRARG